MVLVLVMMRLTYRLINPEEGRERGSHGFAETG